ncbi:hypothetical protein DSO57_1035016 [Entomophthora muscae]|uniref:Uncharacterized protein n=1 Tax=Entomophthora muscae TaxID=34485 RepID=A0ACC2TAP9_9FUNG|nr:hypothetical protein DSO57_1035016 [Entomophthora muscae]
MEQSSLTIQLVPVPIPANLDLLACLQPWSAVFDATRGEVLPKNTQFDFDFKVIVDLIRIVSPIYPLTLKEDTCLDGNYGKFDSLKLDSLVLDTLLSTRESSAAYVNLLTFLA